MISLTLPLPPNANHYRGISWSARRFYLRPEATEYRDVVKLTALAAGIRDPIEGEFDIELVIYRARRAGDTDGFLKVALDAMQGIVYVNDRQVRDIIARKRDDKENPRIEVTVTPLPTSQPSAPPTSGKARRRSLRASPLRSSYR